MVLETNARIEVRKWAIEQVLNHLTTTADYKDIIITAKRLEDYIANGYKEAA